MSRSRARRYPNLKGDAPATHVFYKALFALNPTLSVLDVGCGSGVGTRWLREHFERVAGVDRDAAALSFAREYCPGVPFFGSPLGLSGIDVGILADVLGHAANPETLLRQVRSTLSERAALLIAEPSAKAADGLGAPVRRVFNARTVRSLLLRTGFSAPRWLVDDVAFVSCWALRLHTEASAALVRAAELRDIGQTRTALQELEAGANAADPVLHHEAVQLRAELLMQRGDTAAAGSAFNYARELQPTDPRSLVGLARIALLLSEPVKALRLALDARKLDPHDAHVSTVLARAARALEHPDALEVLRIAFEQTPTDSVLALELAGSYSERGEFWSAANVLERFRSYERELGAEFHVTLAWLLRAQGRIADARSEARLARIESPNDIAVDALYRSLFP